MLSNDELKAFKELRFVLECQDIRLRQLGSKKPRVLHGPGRIFQEADGQLHFEAYVNKAGLELPQSGALGERLPKSRYYSLRATDWRGRVWKCAQVHPSRRSYIPGRFSLMSGEVRQLKGIEHEESPRSINHSITGYVFVSGVSLPANQRTTYRRSRGTGSWSEGGEWDVATFQVDDAEIHFEPDPGQILVRATREGAPFPASYGQRMLEALRFVTGALASWGVLVVSGPEKVEVTLYRLDRRRVGVTPPMPHNTEGSAESTEEMFRRYLTYAMREKRPLYLHRLSAEWGEVLRASQGTLQSQATIWCVVVEALLVLVKAGKGLGTISDPKKRAQVRAWRRRVLKYLEDRKCPAGVQDRFLGATQALLQPSGREILKRLAAMDAVDGKLEKRWSALRNPSAHADREGQGSSDELFRECMAVLALLYQLTFYLIGYEGWFRDYAAKGWPLRKYPLK